MKKILILSICFTSLFQVVYNNHISATVSNLKAAVCEMSEKPVLIEKRLNDNGNTVKVFENGVEVELIDEKTVIIRDYRNAINDKVPDMKPRGWVSIGIAIITVAGYIIDKCEDIQYITGHDICRIVLDYITTPNKNGTYEYELTGNYINDTIPGCEPAHSWQCNGYWEYKVTLQ